jgi:hypothetical protein
MRASSWARCPGISISHRQRCRSRPQALRLGNSFLFAPSSAAQVAGRSHRSPARLRPPWRLCCVHPIRRQRCDGRRHPRDNRKRTGIEPAEFYAGRLSGRKRAAPASLRDGPRRLRRLRSAAPVEFRQRRARADGGMSMFFIVPLRVRIPGVIGSLFTMLVAWPVLAMAAWGLVSAYPLLGWVALTFAAVPIIGRVIERFERKPPTP